MKKIFGITFAVILSLSPLVVIAQSLPGSGSSGFPQGSLSGSGSSGQNPPAQTVGSGGSVTVHNPLGVSSFCGLIQALLTGAIQIGIPIAVLFIVYAGFKFVLARGNSEKLKEARQNFLWTIIGIGIFLGAWLLASVIANTVNSLGSSGGSSIISCQ